MEEQIDDDLDSDVVEMMKMMAMADVVVDEILVEKTWELNQY